MENRKDILQSENLKKSPFMVPEGYFAELTEKVTARTSEDRGPQGVHRFTPYFALAASFIILATVGGWLLSTTAGTSTTEEDAYTAYLSDFIVPQTNPEAIYYISETSAEESLSDEEIIEYLIYEGTPLENLESNFEN